MEIFAKVRDFSDTVSLVESFERIAQYFLDNSLAKEEAWENAGAVLRPVAFYLQMKAPDSAKIQLGDSLAAKPQVIDSICEAIIFPFVFKTGQAGPLEISNGQMLHVVLLVQVCLMECCQSTAMREKLIESGCVFELFKELRNLTRSVQTANQESSKFARQLVQTTTLVVSNCLSDLTDLYMRLYPHTNIHGALVPYFKYPDSIVRITCQLTYHQFAYYLYRSDPQSVACPAMISSYTQYLCAASGSEQLLVRLDKLFLEAEDLMKVLRCLCCQEDNRKKMLDTAEFPKAVLNLLLCDNQKIVVGMLSLLLTILTEGQPISISKGKGRREKYNTKDTRNLMKEKLVERVPDVIAKLQCLVESSYEDVRNLSSSLLWLLQEDPNENFDSCLRYVKSCYVSNVYGECCYWSDYVGQKVSKGIRDEFLLYKAMSKYHIYQRESTILRRLELRQNLGEMKQSRERVFEDTKEVISILGSLKAKGFPMESKCDQFLDCALMDYARELNKCSAKDSLYCMLCRKKGHIVHSHVIPEAILKLLLGGKQEKYVLMGPSGRFFDSQVKTPHTVTFNMLCSDCDTVVLNRDEGVFIENVAKPLYLPPLVDKSQGIPEEIPYGKWFYRFCAGIIFCYLALSRGVTGMVNSMAVLELFHYCRSVVLQSPEVEMNFELPISRQKFPIGLFFTPSMSDEDYGTLNNLIRTLNCNNFTLLSITSAFSTKFNSVRRVCQYCAVHFGVFTVVAFIEKVPDKYHRHLVNPISGKLAIPEDKNRLDFLPPGLLKSFEEKTNQTVKHFLEKFVELTADVRRGSMTVLKSSGAESLSKAESSSFCLLPPNFELNRQTNALVLKDGHTVLLHYTLEQPAASHTVLLCVEYTQPMKPYVILHTYCHSPAISQTFGYYVSLPDWAYAGDLDSDHTKMMHNIRAKNLDLFKFQAKVIPSIMRSIGMSDYQSILYHISRNPTPVFDKKCIPGNGCWYCASKCDICFMNAPAGLIISIQNEAASDESLSIRFDSEECKAFSSHSRDIPFTFSFKKPSCEVKLWIINESSFLVLHLLSFYISSYDEKKQSPFRTSVDIYRVQEGTDAIESGSYIGVFDVTIPGSKTFGECFLSDGLQVEKPLPHVRDGFDKDIVQLINSAILEIILRSGHDLEYFTSIGLHEAKDNSEHAEKNSDEELEIGAALEF